MIKQDMLEMKVDEHVSFKWYEWRMKIHVNGLQILVSKNSLLLFVLVRGTMNIVC